MTQIKTKIPAELEPAAVGGMVTDSKYVKDRVKNKTQEEVNADTEERVSTLEESVGTGGSVDERIAEEGAKHYLKTETYSKTELNNMITTPNQEYKSYTATDQTTAATDVLPASGEADTIYRVGNWDGSQYDTTCYTEYAWNGSAYVLLNTKEYGIDDTPTAGSNNLVKSGGVHNRLRGCAECFIDDSDSDFDIGDMGGNVILQLKDGHIKTKNFDSRNIENEDIFNGGVEVFADNDSELNLNVGDEHGNVIAKFYGGDFKTKNFDSRFFKKKNIKALFCGNSLNQDQITYLPYLLRNLYGDNIDFEICIFYIGAATVKSYVENVITGQQPAFIFSVAKNTESWTNYQSSVYMDDVMNDYEFDLISMQGFFAPGITEDITLLPQLITYFKTHAKKPFEMCWLMHQMYIEGYGTGVINGAITAIKNNGISILFPCYYATEYAKSFMAQSQLTPDNLHNNEGLPCIIGSYVVLSVLSRLYAFQNRVMGNTLRMTVAKYNELNIPGPNGSVDETLSNDIWLQAQDASIKAVNTGDGLFTSAKLEMFESFNN